MKASPNPIHLFVYGTLRRGGRHPMARRLAREARFVGTGTIAGRLYDLGPYPAAVASRSRRERVHGDIYRLTDPGSLLAALDRYEGCAPCDPEPHEFVRRRVGVRFAGGGSLAAWAYFWQGDPGDRPVVQGGDYSARRRPLPVRKGP